MVQPHVTPLQQGIPYSPREWSRNERSFDSCIPPQEERFPAASVHPRVLSVEDALRDCARIPVKDFALVVLTESGDERTYLSRSLIPHQSKIITDRFRQEFQRCVRRAANEGQYPSSSKFRTSYVEASLRRRSQDGMFNEWDQGSEIDSRKRGLSDVVHRPHSRKIHSDDSDDDDRSSNSNGPRKKPRFPYREKEETSNPLPIQKTQQLVIGDSTQLQQFLSNRFKDMQQSACKVMGKAFVKTVEPKKQTHHPYTKGDEKAPPWWPNTGGENRVRHREPDHLLKPERIILLVHCALLVCEPCERQDESIQKLGLNVKKLEEATMEAMSPWFSDKEHPGNERKRPFLKEIFKILKAYERFRNGEIDGSTVIPVMHGDRAALDGSDDDEDTLKEEEEEAATAATIRTPDSLVSPPLGLPHPLQRSESDPNFRIPMGQRHHPMEEHSPYTDSFYQRPMGVGFQPQSPTMNEQTRRGFQNPMYGTNPNPGLFNWQNTMMNNSGISGNFYTTSPQSSLPPASASYQLPPPTSQQPMLPPPLSQQHFDSIPPNSRPYDPTGIHNQLRTGSLGHPHQIPHGYEGGGYLRDPSPFAQQDPEMEHGMHQSQ